MASPVRVRENLTLEAFLTLPEEEPSLEYIDGRIKAKVSPRFKHGVISTWLAEHLNAFARPTGRGMAIVELRCTFAGRSIVPDVAFQLAVHIGVGQDGKYADAMPHPPDIHVEVVSPEQSIKSSREKLVHSTAHGCSLGWLIHPDQDWVEVFRPGQTPVRLSAEGALEGEPVLPGFRLPVAELFGWLRPQGSGPQTSPPAPGNGPA